MGYVALDRVVRDEGYEPPYCVHGYTWCVNCRHQVYLGVATYKAVTRDKHAPICLDCVNQYATIEDRTGKVYEDHLRANGPHD